MRWSMHPASASAPPPTRSSTDSRNSTCAARCTLASGDGARTTGNGYVDDSLGDADDRAGRVGVSRRTEERRIAEGEDASVSSDVPVTGGAGSGLHGNDGLVESLATGGSEEVSISEGEDATVTSHQPVPL